MFSRSRNRQRFADIDSKLLKQVDLETAVTMLPKIFEVAMKVHLGLQERDLRYLTLGRGTCGELLTLWFVTGRAVVRTQ